MREINCVAQRNDHCLKMQIDEVTGIDVLNNRSLLNELASNRPDSSPFVSTLNGKPVGNTHSFVPGGIYLS